MNTQPVQITRRPRQIARSITATIFVALGLTGCQGTIHNRWATENDTVENWQDALQAMPIEIHGKLNEENATALAKLVPNGTTPDLFSVQGSVARLRDTARVVVYAGTDVIPTDDTYCRANPSMREIAVTPGRIDMAAALCDGTRLVVRARRELTQENISGHGITAEINAMKSRLLLALTVNPSIPPVYNG